MDALASVVTSVLFVVLIAVIPVLLFILFAWGLRTWFEGAKTENEPAPRIRNDRLGSEGETLEQERAVRHREAQEQIEKKQRYAREAEYAAGLRKLQLEVEDRNKKLSQIQGGSPKKVLIAELELAEKESELEYYQSRSDLSEEKRLEFQSRLAALREQIKREKKAWWKIFGI